MAKHTTKAQIIAPTYVQLLLVYIIPLLVGGIPTPLKNMTSSVGMMTFPTEWKNQIHVPNHQPDEFLTGERR